MEEVHYYHMYANGDDAQNFITTEEEFKTAFNRFGVCQHEADVAVLSCSAEDSHPHALLRGTYDRCLRFKNLYESISTRSIIQNRGSADGVVLKCELLEIEDNSHLMNVGTYTIVQATKDGKAVMPYDYRYGTGALYFRSRYSILPWLIDDNGNVCEPVPFRSLNRREQLKICASKYMIPDDWLICNGFILPTNYIDIKGFEDIYKTHNCFRAFLSSGKAKDEPLLQRMAMQRGVVVEDLLARKYCEEICLELFGKKTAKYATIEQRLTVAQRLRSIYHLAYRQLATLTYLPETEVRKYVK